MLHAHSSSIFQSHYGAIATRMPCAHFFGMRLSIPLWCDCNLLSLTQLMKFTLLSIPLWCDCNGGIKVVSPDSGPLSIPLWCDCNRCKALMSDNAFYLSIPLWCDCNACASLTIAAMMFFQSHYGAIATALAPYPLHCTDLLSIPLWCDCNHQKIAQVARA